MEVKEILHILESWAPKELSWQGDNIGLQVGSPNRSIKKILVALDVTEQVIAEAHKKQANLIISHHPLIFNPLKSLTPETRTGALALSLVEKQIALISAHTNLDFTRGGVSIALAEQLGLLDIQVLAPQQDILHKLTVYIPESHADAVMSAMAQAGAGNIGNYEACSFRMRGMGTFKGNESAQPFNGKKGALEQVEEIRLEMVVHSWNVSGVVRAMKETHPYEEVAYDLVTLDNSVKEFGTGAIGTLPSAESVEAFLLRVRKSLDAPALRYSKGKAGKIKTVAVCGGSGSQFVSAAISQKADAYVTADVKYHAFQSAESKIVLVDAGHFETERPIIKKVVSYCSQECKKRGATIPVIASASMSNPVNYFYS